MTNGNGVECVDMFSTVPCVHVYKGGKDRGVMEIQVWDACHSQQTCVSLYHQGSALNVCGSTSLPRRHVHGGPLAPYKDLSDRDEKRSEGNCCRGVQIKFQVDDEGLEAEKQYNEGTHLWHRDP